MKTFVALSLLLVLLGPVGVTGMSPFKVRPPTALLNQNKQRSNPSQWEPTPLNSYVLVPVGGEETGDGISFDLDLAAAILVQVFGAMSALHGVILAVAPSIGLTLLGRNGESDKGGAAGTYAEEAIGVFSLEYGLTGYLAVTGLVSPEKAIGYGMLPDLFFLGKNLVNGNFAEFGVQKLMTVLTSLAALGTAAILTDNLHLGPILEILTIVPAAQGIPKYLDPVGAGKKMLGTDLSDRPVAKALYRHSGQVKIVSAIFRGAIAFGVAPFKALGYSALADSVMIADSIIRHTTDEVVGGDNKRRALYHQIGSLVLSLTMGAVFILKGE